MDSGSEACALRQCILPMMSISRPPASDTKASSSAIIATSAARGTSPAMLGWIKFPDFFPQDQQTSSPTHYGPRFPPLFPPWKREACASSTSQPCPQGAAPHAPPRVSHASSRDPMQRNSLTTSTSYALPEESGALCVEVSDGLRRVYRPRGAATDGFQMEEERQTHGGRMRALVGSYILPQGFPESVAPEYSSYMFWRGVQVRCSGGRSGWGRG